MESAGAGIPVRGVEECVQEHSTMLHHLGAMMDHVVQTMDRWERQKVSPVPRPVQPELPLPVTGKHYDPGRCGSFLYVLSSPPSARSSYCPTDCGSPVYARLPALRGA
jgi:hypothetical protein